MIEDLSFSNIVGIINHDKKVGGAFLVNIAREKEVVDNNLKDLEIRLQQLKTRQLQLRKGSLLVLKHLGKEAPLTVKEKDFVVVVTGSDINIERNVL